MYKFINTDTLNLTFISGSITVGSSGAVSASTGPQIASVTKNTDAGDYTITLKKGFNKLLGFHACVVKSGFSDVFAIEIDPAGATADADLQNKLINIQLYDASKGDVNAASGSVIKFFAFVRDGNVGNE